MAQIVKLPFPATKLGFKRVKKRCKAADPKQLNLFPATTAQIIDFAPELSPFEQALRLDEQGDLHAADLYAKAIERQDCVADAFCNLGILESHRENTIKAFDCFTTALKHDPRHSEAHYNLANLYFDQNDFRLARLHFAMAAEFDPEFANAYFNLALACTLSSDLEGALKSLRKYQELVSDQEARAAAELLDSVNNSVATANLASAFRERLPR